jgi:hypothetical protein
LSDGAQYNCPQGKLRVVSLWLREIALGWRGKNLVFSLCTIPAVGFYEKHEEIASQHTTDSSLFDPTPPSRTKKTGKKISYPVRIIPATK